MFLAFEPWALARLRGTATTRRGQDFAAFVWCPSTHTCSDTGRPSNIRPRSGASNPCKAGSTSCRIMILLKARDNCQVNRLTTSDHWRESLCATILPTNADGHNNTPRGSAEVPHKSHVRHAAGVKVYLWHALPVLFLPLEASDGNTQRRWLDSGDEHKDEEVGGGGGWGGGKASRDNLPVGNCIRGWGLEGEEEASAEETTESGRERNQSACHDSRRERSIRLHRHSLKSQTTSWLINLKNGRSHYSDEHERKTVGRHRVRAHLANVLFLFIQHWKEILNMFNIFWRQ